MNVSCTDDTIGWIVWLHRIMLPCKWHRNSSWFIFKDNIVQVKLQFNVFKVRFWKFWIILSSLHSKTDLIQRLTWFLTCFLYILFDFIPCHFQYHQSLTLFSLTFSKLPISVVLNRCNLIIVQYETMNLNILKI